MPHVVQPPGTNRQRRHDRIEPEQKVADDDEDAGDRDEREGERGEIDNQQRKGEGPEFTACRGAREPGVFGGEVAPADLPDVFGAARAAEWWWGRRRS